MEREASTGGAREQRARLIAAARACFARHGVAKTAIEDVAREAGVSRPTVYRYLGDRTTLIRTVVVEQARQIIEETHRVMETYPDFEDKVVEGMLHAVARSREDPVVGILVSPEHMALASQVVAMSETTVDLNVELWMPTLRKAQNAGYLRSDLNLREFWGSRHECGSLLGNACLFVG
jgi:AcrR family transcriptional regulator